MNNFFSFIITWKQVSEAIQIGARAIKENGIDVEEVERCLQELGDSIDSQKQVEEALGKFFPVSSFFFFVPFILRLHIGNVIAMLIHSVLIIGPWKHNVYIRVYFGCAS